MIPRSLRARVTVVGVLTLAVILSVGSWLTIRALSAALRSDLDAQNAEVLERLADQIALGADPRTLAIPVGADGTDFLILDDAGRPLNISFAPVVPAPGAEGLPSNEGIGSGLIEAEQGVFIAGTDGVVEFASEAEFVAFLIQNGELAVTEADQIPDEVAALTSDWFQTERTITAPSGEELTLVALSPFGILSRSIDRLAIALLVIVPLVVALGGAALWFAIGSALEPVARLAGEARRIAPSNSGDRLEVPESGDEIAELTVTLNEMLDRLDAGLQRQRQFVSDASHELRSPLTAVRAAGDLVAEDQRLPDDLRPSVAALNRGVGRLGSILDDLTDLAQAGAATAKVEVDLADLVAEAVEASDGSAVDGDDQPSVDRRGVTPAVVNAHPVRLERAVRNLVENARRHAETTVAVATTVDDGTVRITVDDDGPGVPPEDRARIFERFVRLDDARDRAKGGSGLGLAIVATIAKDHGGSVRCEDGPLGGARFTLTFPT
ncbi:MAG: HAMP domain-containing sensor histidine kinase [Actinomycetota bacterium]